MTMNTFRRDDRAVSELIGYLFIFASIMSAVVLLSLAAMPIIDNQQSFEQANTMEYVLDNLDGEIEKVLKSDDERWYRSELPAGQFNQMGETTIVISSDGATDDITIETKPLQYQTGTDHVLLYDAGATALIPSGSEGSDAHMRSNPSQTYMQNDLMFRVAALDHPDSVEVVSSTGSHSAQFFINRSDKTSAEEVRIFEDGVDDNVEIAVNTEIPNFWEAYLENHPAFENVDSSGSVVEADLDWEAINGDQFVVTYVEIELSIQN